MALVNLKFSSVCLGMDTSINIILPEVSKGVPISGKYPVLYLLHGLGGNENSWIKNTSIERYCKDLGLIVVMPCGGRSFYTNMHHGYKYFSYLTEELPTFLKRFFPISDSFDETFIAGLSMGGYGALRTALTCAGKFSIVGSLSGAVNLRDSIISQLRSSEFEREMVDVFGINSLDNTEYDLINLAKQCNEDLSPKPLIYQFCGTEDFLYPMNLSFKNFIEKETNLHLIYEEEPGTHDWALWDKSIVSFLNIIKNKILTCPN